MCVWNTLFPLYNPCCIGTPLLSRTFKSVLPGMFFCCGLLLLTLEACGQHMKEAVFQGIMPSPSTHKYLGSCRVPMCAVQCLPVESNKHFILQRGFSDRSIQGCREPLAFASLTCSTPSHSISIPLSKVEIPTLDPVTTLLLLCPNNPLFGDACTCKEAPPSAGSRPLKGRCPSEPALLRGTFPTDDTATSVCSPSPSVLHPLLFVFLSLKETWQSDSASHCDPSSQGDSSPR